MSERWDALEAVDLQVLGQLWLGRRTRLEGRRVECFDLAAGSPVRRGFARAVLHRPERELERYWIEQALSGGHLPPRELATPEELFRRVAARRGAIGYLDWDAFLALRPDGVRVLPVRVGGEPLYPQSAAYPIRWAEEPPAEAGAPTGEAAARQE